MDCGKHRGVGGDQSEVDGCGDCDRPSSSRAMPLRMARRTRAGGRAAVEQEAEWRRPLHGPASDEAGPLAVSRWQAFAGGMREVQAQTPGDSHVVKIVLRTMNLSFDVDGRSVHDGLATAGMLHVTEPGAAARCVFRGRYDTLHLHVSNALIGECLQDMPARPVLTASRRLIRDFATERLARTLLAAAQDGGSLGPLMADAIGIAIVARLLRGLRGERGGIGTPGAGLVEMAAETGHRLCRSACRRTDPGWRQWPTRPGLTRMHFAAQFRAATGLPPHEYLLRRRIECAQEMLLDAERPVVDIALSLGFQTQSHLSPPPSRGSSDRLPHAWRLAQRVTKSGR